MTNADRLKFSEHDHRYTLDGKTVPGVTTIIRIVTQEKHWGEDWHLQRGKAAHACYQMLASGIDFQCADILEPYVEGWEAFARDYTIEPIGVEMKVASERHKYAGTLDLLANVDGELAVVDYKQFAADPACKLQLAAYTTALAEWSDVQVKTGYAVEIDGKGGYRIAARVKGMDMKRRQAQFVACRTVFDLIGKSVKAKDKEDYE